jgi:hypothetical protein
MNRRSGLNCISPLYLATLQVVYLDDRCVSVPVTSGGSLSAVLIWWQAHMCDGLQLLLSGLQTPAAAGTLDKQPTSYAGGKCHQRAGCPQGLVWLEETSVKAGSTVQLRVLQARCI